MDNDKFEEYLEEIADIAKNWADSPQLKGRLRLVLVQAINNEHLLCAEKLRGQPTDYAI
jgi:predicted metal-dependent enzyme (double-stranded beta helix superfamily)